MSKSDVPSATAGLASVGVFQPDAIRAAWGDSLEQLEELNRAWLGAVTKTMESTWILATQLPKCADPGQAVSVCKTWFAERSEAAVADGKNLAQMWLKLCRVDHEIFAPIGAASRAFALSPFHSPRSEAAE